MSTAAEVLTYEVRRGWSHYAERKKSGLWVLEELYSADDPDSYLEILATVGRKIVGYQCVRDRTIYPHVIHARGTWVADALRRCGVATQLWSLALEETQPRKVVVYVVSDEGRTLVESLRRRFPKVTWDLLLDANGLRDLRQGKEKILDL